ncbi:sensor histidine kinase [Dactylosporangium roseum]|uniref:sensor histidine kinase n=1 Tax=Dactylosporangium roseum TaxID=47989 RepID=UPI0021B4C713|nr:sensor histidine kinase [Dactylosporangium roseum]
MLVAVIALGALFSVVLVGLASIVAVALSGIPVARIERWRLGLVDENEVADPHRTPDKPGVRAWVYYRLKEGVTWRELGYTMLMISILCWVDMIVITGVTTVVTSLVFGPAYIDEVPIWLTSLLSMAGLVLAVASAYPLAGWAGVRAAIARAILAPRTDDHDPRLVELTQSRARLVDAFEIERRRIERDLHDGAQQRLLALSMELGMARMELPDRSPAAESVERAHRLTKEALTALRELIRGVHPKILTDRGLDAALREVADRATVPVDLDLTIPHRLPQSVEVAAYFAVVEALTNVTKHSGARRARVAASVRFDRLSVQIRDDGLGGADPARGTGLTGLADRVAALDGKVSFASPVGGPTVVHVEIPCGS